MNTPNNVSPIVGYRAWRWNTSGFAHSALLSSLNGELWYPGRALAAACRHPIGWTVQAQAGNKHHEAPQMECGCGIYAVKTPDLLSGVHFAPLGPYGEVHLWGTVVEHSLGWRAQYAYPKTIVLSPESLLFGGFFQVSRGTEEVEFALHALTAYRVNIFWKDDEGSTTLWTVGGGYEAAGIERLRGVLPQPSLLTRKTPFGSIAARHSARQSARSRKTIADFSTGLLSARELAVLHHLAQGLTNHEIAERMGIDHFTLKNWLVRMFDKLGVSNRVELLCLGTFTLRHTGGSKPN
jgi:DNA-binding CsgD family transcriptional regulator